MKNQWIAKESGSPSPADLAQAIPFILENLGTDSLLEVQDVLLIPAPPHVKLKLP